MQANALRVSLAADGERLCLRATAEMNNAVVEMASSMKGVLFASRDGGTVILTLEPSVFQASRLSYLTTTLARALNPRQPRVVYYQEKSWTTAAQFLAAIKG